MLKAEIEKAKRDVNTDTVGITLGEVSNMYTLEALLKCKALTARSAR